MLEIRLSLPHGHIYVGGQTIRCTLTFVNSTDSDTEKAPESAALFLSWATVQLECVANLSARAASCSKLALAAPPSKSKALGRKGSTTEVVIFQGQPKLLFCDCSLGPLQNRTVEFSDQLPTDAPPSFDGDAVRIFYRLTIGVQRPNQPIKLAKIPIRVLPLPVASVSFPTGDTSPVRKSFSESFRRSGNPFVEDLEIERDAAAVALTATPAPPSPLFEPPYICNSRTYTINAGVDSIKKQPRLVCSLTIDKQIIRIGDAVVGLFDFSRSTVHSLKWSAKLSCEELIPSATESNEEVSMGKNVIAQQEELCLHSVMSNLFLPVPPDVTPTFESGIVGLRWRVHFEFTLLKNDCKVAAGEQSNAEGGYTSWRLMVSGDGGILPNSVATQATETLSWDMDIKLIAANPKMLTALHYLPPTNTVTVH